MPEAHESLVSRKTGAEVPLTGLSFHRVAIAANEYFQELIEHARLEFLPLGTAAEYRELVTDPGLFHPVRGPMTAFRAMAKLIQPQFDIAAEFARRDEVVVLASSLALGARIARDTFGFSLASVHVQPVWRFSRRSPRRSTTCGTRSACPRSHGFWRRTGIRPIG